MSEAVNNIDQVIYKIKRLLVVLCLNFDERVAFVPSICSQRLYFIKLLQSHKTP